MKIQRSRTLIRTITICQQYPTSSSEYSKNQQPLYNAMGSFIRSLTPEFMFEFSSIYISRCLWLFVDQDFSCQRTNIKKPTSFKCCKSCNQAGFTGFTQLRSANVILNIQNLTGTRRWQGASKLTAHLANRHTYLLHMGARAGTFNCWSINWSMTLESHYTCAENYRQLETRRCALASGAANPDVPLSDILFSFFFFSCVKYI